jgi:amidophosphoribosyltransferase
MCGVFGILDENTANLGHMLYYGLYALQHRGQESCGMAVFDHDDLFIHKEMGLVNQVFTETLLEKLKGQVGIGHTRYSTTGSSSLENAQPVVARSPLGAMTIAHNGNLTNTTELLAYLRERAIHLPAKLSDSHVMAEMIRYELHQAMGRHEVNLLSAVSSALAQCQGAFSVVVATGDTLIAVRDPHGLRPLSLGRLDSGAWVVASETCALDIVGATFVRDIEPGEIWMATRDGAVESRTLPAAPKNHLCIFELIYFARPDSQIRNHSVYNYRLALGERLAQLSPPVQADIVIPVPDSGNVAAVGYSRVSGIPYVEGLIKNRYVGRTFINPTQELREQGIKLKLNPMSDVIAGKSVVVVDDSIVRGNTSRQLVRMLRDAGAKEIHLRISSAPVKNPCYYGIDMSTRQELIANKMSVEELRTWLNVNTLVYLPEDDMRAIAENHSACMACFNGHYPAGMPTSLAAEAL